MSILGRYVLLQSAASHPTHMVRLGVDIARSGVDLLQICLVIEGQQRGEFGGRVFNFGPGDVGFIDCGQPFECEATQFRMLALLVPRDLLPPNLAKHLVHGLVLDAKRPATEILASLLRQTFTMAPNLTPVEAEAAVRAVVSLADGMCEGGLTLRKDAAPGNIDLFTTAQAAIERLLEDADLSAATLQKLLHVSRATLYELFAEHGGVQAYIRERRLRRCYEIFKSNYRVNETIGAVAFSLGFRSEAHFSRAFKERFGLSPRTLRQESRAKGGNLQPVTAAGLAPHFIQTLLRDEAK